MTDRTATYEDPEVPPAPFTLIAVDDHGHRWGWAVTDDIQHARSLAATNPTTYRIIDGNGVEVR